LDVGPSFGTSAFPQSEHVRVPNVGAGRMGTIRVT
jgi:hypothetical protein